MAASRIGIDTGGTFTDVVCLDGTRRRTTKVPSTPDDPARAVKEGLAAVGGLPSGGHLHHGSTVGTNAVLTRDGARVGLLVTRGFEDLLHVGRGHREDLHAFQARRTEPLLPREACLGVDERLGADGRVVRPLGRGEVERLAAEVDARGFDAVAICLLHAVRQPRHERRLLRALRRACAARGVSVRISSDLSADGREVERAATTVLDAYVAPKVVGYVERIARDLPAGALTVMRSDGGRMGMGEVRRAPVRTLLSGPAAGVAAAHALSRRHGLDRALSFDVGGTSTDVAWLGGDDLAIASELTVGAHVAAVPALAVETVGAGGGSLVTVDAGGALRVGPRSAGADPGPAAYGRGGPFTLSDAWVLLRRLPDALLDGTFPLDRAAAERAARPIARAAGCTPRALAEGALRVAAATTARALRRASVARGHDPRGAALVAFGGAGPLLAARTAGLLGIGRVLVPVDPGLFAAQGALEAPLRADVAHALGGEAPEAAGALRRRLAAEVRARLREQGAAAVGLRVEVEARYAGQAFEVAVPYSRAWAERFHEAHARAYGFRDDSREIEPVRLRVRGEGHERGPPRGDRRAAAVRARRRRVAPPRVGPARVPRGDLVPGDRLAGPLRVEELSGTTWIPRGWTVSVLAAGELEIETRIGIECTREDAS